MSCLLTPSPKIREPATCEFKIDTRDSYFKFTSCWDSNYWAGTPIYRNLSNFIYIVMLPLCSSTAIAFCTPILKCKVETLVVAVSICHFTPRPSRVVSKPVHSCTFKFLFYKLNPIIL